MREKILYLIYRKSKKNIILRGKVIQMTKTSSKYFDKVG